MSEHICALFIPSIHLLIQLYFVGMWRIKPLVKTVSLYCPFQLQSLSISVGLFGIFRRNKNL